MSLEAATYVSDLVTTNPVSADNVSQGDDHIRLLKDVLQTTFPDASKPLFFPKVLTKTANYPVVDTDDKTVFVGNGAAGNITLTLPSLTAAEAGWSIAVYNAHATNDTIIAPPSGTISGAANVTLDYQHATAMIYWTGSVYISFQDYVAKVTKDRLDNITANRLLGRYDTGGAFQEITVGSGLALGAGPTLTANTVLPRGYIDGCIGSNNSGDATNDIDISAGVCRDSTNTVNITIAASTKQLDANWVAGTSGGMRNSAAGITDTTYHIYAVATAAGVSGIYAHTSTTVATVLTALQAETGGADYVYARRIFSIIRASAAILGFFQVGDEFLLNVPVDEVANTGDSSSAQTATLAGIPAGIKVEALLRVVILTGNNGGVLFTSPDVADAAPSITGTPGVSIMCASGDRASGELRVRSNTSRAVRYRSTHSTIDVWAVSFGWRDWRGKDA